MTGKKGAGGARTAQGIEAFEKAVRAVGKRDFERAREILDALIAQHPEEKDLIERARAYRTICDRGLDKRPSFRPKTFEELLTYGVFQHNRGEFEEAIKFLQQAAEMHPRNENVLYCLAASLARQGDTPGAIKALRGSVTANPRNRSQARGDEDFEELRGSPEFDSLVRFGDDEA